MARDFYWRWRSPRRRSAVVAAPADEAAISAIIADFEAYERRRTR
jgi:hypothetical protein